MKKTRNDEAEPCDFLQIQETPEVAPLFARDNEDLLSIRFGYVTAMSLVVLKCTKQKVQEKRKDQIAVKYCMHMCFRHLYPHMRNHRPAKSPAKSVSHPHCLPGARRCVILKAAVWHLPVANHLRRTHLWRALPGLSCGTSSSVHRAC